MTNLFQMLKNYKDENKDHTYGSINNPDQSLRESLTQAEWMLYNQIKSSDRARLIKSSRAPEK